MMLLKSPAESLLDTAACLKEQRLALNMTQEQLSKRANVSLSVLRKFERSGKISLESFVKLTFVLRLNEQIIAALNATPKTISSLDEILNDTEKSARQRASRPRKK